MTALSRREFILDGVAAAAGLAASLHLRQASADSEAPMPLNSWVRRPRPRPDGIGLSKHTRWTQDPATGFWWMSGGDYSASIGNGDRNFPQSGRQEVRVFDPLKHRMEIASPYVTPPGELNAQHPDETGWCFDPKRRVCWLIPGYQGPDRVQRSIHNRVMTFNVETRKWADVAPVFMDPGSSFDGTPQGRFSTLDPVTDTIYHPYGTGVGPVIAKLQCSALEWKRQYLGYPGGTRLELHSMGSNYHAFDERRRRLTFSDLVTRHLVFYEIDSGRWIAHQTRGNPPPRVSNTYAFVWDGDTDSYLRFSGRVNHDGSLFVGPPGDPKIDLWAIPAGGDTWMEIPLTGDLPPLTDSSILLWDRLRHRLMLISGPQEENDGSIHYLKLDPATVVAPSRSRS